MSSPLFALALSFCFLSVATVSVDPCQGRFERRVSACRREAPGESPACEAAAWSLMLAGGSLAGAVLRQRRPAPARS